MIDLITFMPGKNCFSYYSPDADDNPRLFADPLRVRKYHICIFPLIYSENVAALLITFPGSGYLQGSQVTLQRHLLGNE